LNYHVKPTKVTKPRALQLGVNFINILHTLFAPIFLRQKISNPKHSFVIFGTKFCTKKRAHKILMKLIIGVTEILTKIEQLLNWPAIELPFQ
jgi:hypothetical protein